MKTVLITGATSGLGLMLSRYYDSLGHNLITVGRNQNKLNSLKKEISKKNQKNSYALDFKSKINYEKFLQILKKNEKKIDIIIHCLGGGFGFHNPIISYEDLNFLFQYEVSLNYLCLSKCIPFPRRNLIHQLNHMLVVWVSALEL